MGNWKKGQPANPKGKTATKWGEWIRNHPKTPYLLQKLFDVALDDKHKMQLKAIQILTDRIAPSLKASELKIDGDLKPGVIVLPEKRVEALRVSSPTRDNKVSSTPSVDAEA